MKKILLSLTLVSFSILAVAQSTISGTILDDTGEGLPGATVLVKGTQNGSITDINGKFTINAKEGTPLVVSFIGFESVEMAASNDMSVTLKPGTSILAEVVITSNVIDVVKERQTPVAVSSIAPSEIALKVGNLEFPEVMARTPGVYVTREGGGYGDSRLSLRGFDQNNTSFLINGQPVNDMENGWVYWSNWQGLTDVASGIQIQRGLGASRLAVPSVGGTVSIFTKAAELEPSFKISETIGNNNYSKSTISYSSGKGESGWASSFLLSYWKGDGYVDATSGEGLTYFGAVGYSPEGSDHSFNISLIGAGQWHHQRTTWISIRDYQNFGDDAKDGINRRWNTEAGTLNGEEFNLRRNFYNKPLATLNWDWQINDNLSLATSLYGSAGRGGGTGPRGENFRNNDIDINPFGNDLTGHLEDGSNGGRNADGTINFDEIVSVNRATTDGYNGLIGGGAYEGYKIGSNRYSDDNVNRAVLVRRASMNSHNWIGGISNLNYETQNFKYSIGVDLRRYVGYHYRVVTDLLGLDGYQSGGLGSGSRGNQNTGGIIIDRETLIDPSPFKNTGITGTNKIDYYNLGIVNWQGVNGLVEYRGNENLTAVIQGGISNQGFQREDYFDQVGNPVSEVQNQTGGYLKGGANYNVSDASNVFFNAGFISRQPLFDAVFPGFANDINPDLQNEQITSIELGYGYLGRYLTVNVNAYNTVWGNRFDSKSNTFLINNVEVDGTAQFKDIDVLHQGVEVEATYRAMDNLKLRGMLSLGNWRYTNDFTADYFDDNQDLIVGESATIYVKDEKVGDAAQTTAFLSADYQIGIASVDLSYRYFDNLYADYGVGDSSLEDPDNLGVIKLPSYGLVDFGVTTRFNAFGANGIFRVNVNNLFDTVYIAESNTNIHMESGDTAYNGVNVMNSVWFGFGRTWNATLSFSF